MARSNVTFAILGVFVGYVLALPYVAALQSPSYSRVVVFGDSLVDNVRAGADAGKRHVQAVEPYVARGLGVL